MRPARTLLVIGDRLEHGGQTRLPRPRRDHEELRRFLDAELLDASILPRPRGRALGGWSLARAVAQRAGQYDNVFCDSEHIAIPLAWLLRRHAARTRLTFIAHYLTPAKKRLLIRLLGTPRQIDHVIVHSDAQAARARSLGFSDAQVACVPYQVDAEFFAPGHRSAAGQGYIASAGQEFRDYATLLQAVEGLPVSLEIAAGSHWSRRRHNFDAAALPANVHARRRDYVELREMYDGARFAVVPLHDVDFPAGIITILEAMAMGKAVIVSATRGQTGTVSGPLMDRGALREIGERTWHEATGLYVPPGDAASLRAAIAYLLERPHVAKRMGAAARQHVLASFTIERFVERLAAIIEPQRTREAVRT